MAHKHHVVYYHRDYHAYVVGKRQKEATVVVGVADSGLCSEAHHRLHSCDDSGHVGAPSLPDSVGFRGVEVAYRKQEDGYKYVVVRLDAFCEEDCGAEGQKRKGKAVPVAARQGA